ncbi:MAG: hypothetical protein Q8R48_00150 [Candidatus Omnitrophota bacterium]|nr:hypothetical protein [Candidatus Omnitrophota bacterium]
MTKMSVQKKGYALVYVILAMILANILAASLYTAAFLHNRLFMQLRLNKAAYYTACTGVEYGRYIIRFPGRYPIPGAWPPNDPPPAPPDVTISITSDGATPPVFTINSTGTYSDSGVQKNIIVTCGQGGDIITWQTSG